jgi:hypothetical protein
MGSSCRYNPVGWSPARVPAPINGGWQQHYRLLGPTATVAREEFAPRFLSGLGRSLVPGATLSGPPCFAAVSWRTFTRANGSPSRLRRHPARPCRVSEQDPLWSKPCLAYNLHAELDDARTSPEIPLPMMAMHMLLLRASASTAGAVATERETRAPFYH